MGRGRQRTGNLPGGTTKAPEAEFLWPPLKNASRGRMARSWGGASVEFFVSPYFVPSRGPVLAVAMGSNSEYCYSGGADARIHSWKIPDLNMDPYDGYGETALALPSPRRLLGPLPSAHAASICPCLPRQGLAGCSAWLSVQQRDSACGSQTRWLS